MAREETETTFICDLSGELSLGVDPMDTTEDDPLGDLPVGWSVLSVQQRIENPRHLEMLKAREAAFSTMLEQSGIQGEEEGYATLECMVDAQFLPMLEREPRFIVEDVVELVIAPAHIATFLKMIGLEDEIEVPLVSPSIVPHPVVLPSDDESEEIVEEPEEEEDIAAAAVQESPEENTAEASA